jgi:hypothetical protein
MEYMFVQVLILAPAIKLVNYQIMFFTVDIKQIFSMQGFSANAYFSSTDF